MSHLICLHARAGGFATRWGENWFAEAAMNGRRMAMGSPTHPINGRSDRTAAPSPSNYGRLHGTVTPLPSNDGKSHGAVTSGVSIGSKLHGTSTSGASIDRQSHRTGPPLLSNDGQSHRVRTSAPSIDRIFESFGSVLASQMPFWHLSTLNRPPNHARAPI